jgi:hypothetical protein
MQRTFKEYEDMQQMIKGALANMDSAAKPTRAIRLCGLRCRTSSRRQLHVWSFKMCVKMCSGNLVCRDWIR